MGLARVEVRRGAVVESRHAVSIAVADGEGVLRATAGDAELVTFARSAIKPLQALPLVDDGVAETFGFGAAELALACASHSG
ncbi:MAG TPA: asparaginase, partial [Longimicrobiales bacterium]|nr:asparaginase [Longimicrobiales bacterium]